LPLGIKPQSHAKQSLNALYGIGASFVQFSLIVSNVAIVQDRLGNCRFNPAQCSLSLFGLPLRNQDTACLLARK
jgi:hypothetical protein